MTDQPEGEPDFSEMVNNLLGDEAAKNEFFAQLEDPMKEAWGGFHQIYLGLLSGGFTRMEAQTILGVYLYTMLAGGETN